MNSIVNNLYKWFLGKKAPPEMVQIYPTNKCNLKCIFCVQRLGIYNLKEEVSTKRFLEITRELCKMGVKKFLISGGGEPLCTPNKTLKIMEKIKAYGAEGRMITSGFLWNELLIKKTVKMGWDCIAFSIHGSKEKTHDYLTGVKKVFQKVIGNIKLFGKLKRQFNSILPYLEFTFVINKCNFNEIEELVKLANEIGVESVNLEPLCINNEEAEKIKLNDKERKLLLNKILPRAEKLSKKLGIRNNFDRIKEVKFLEKAGKMREEILKNISKEPKDFFNLPCYEPWLWPKIEANGEVWPCSTVQMKTTNIKNRSFKEIWYGKEFEEFRNRIIERNLPKECENCVLTHLPINKKIREEFKNFVKSKIK